MSQLSKSVQYAYRSKIVLRLYMHRQHSVLKKRYEKLVIEVHVIQNTLILVILRCCFAEDGKKMYHDSKHTCRTIVLFCFWIAFGRRGSIYLTDVCPDLNQLFCNLHDL